MDAIDNRCPWCLGSQRYIDYHDQEWGRPVREEQKMFELLILETFQAGLSWSTILNKREYFREAFYNFDIDTVANMDDSDIEELLQNKGIIRNRKKIVAAINNARTLKELHKNGQRLVDLLWGYVNGTPINNKRSAMTEVPAVTELAIKISKDLKNKGFKFIGPTTMYAHMQACGMVNDHLITCPAYTECLE